MGYRFKRGEASAADGFRRIAREQIDKAIAAIDDAGQREGDEVVHEVRTRCKEVRALLRLVRPEFADYARENAAMRDAADLLSSTRDARVQIASYDFVTGAYREQIERRELASIRRQLTLRLQRVADDASTAAHMADLRDRMTTVRRRTQSWRLASDGFDAFAGGLERTYRRARKSMGQAQAAPCETAFHDWRKRVKDHLYHARMLEPIWPGPMKAHRKAAKELGSRLGRHHDLAVLRQALADEPAAFGDIADVEVVVGLIGRRQAVLEAEAFALGARLLAEPPRRLAGRWEMLWTAWRHERPAHVAALRA